MNYRITILCDNSVGALSGTLGEHGFAALVEWQGGSLLFDTGQGDTLLHNAMRMKRDLHEIAGVALSHGHYDHTGGLLPLLRHCGGKEIFTLTPDCLPAVTGSKTPARAFPSASPYDQAFLQGLGGKFSFSKLFRDIAPGIFLTGEIPRKSQFEKGDAGLCCDDAGCSPDPLEDDQTLVVRTARGLVLILGCCHAGLINTIDHARRETGETEIYAVLGGTHLGFCSQAQLDETIKELKDCGVKKICAGHCTGFAAAARLSAGVPRSLSSVTRRV